MQNTKNMSTTPSPTPETDAVAISYLSVQSRSESYWIPADFARRLETERDAAREALRQVLAEFTNPQTRGQERALEAVRKLVK